MAIGKGSMERASKAVKKTVDENTEVKSEQVKNVVKTKPERKTVKTPAEKKSVVKKAPEKTVVVPTKQVMDMVIKDRIEVGDEMPIYFY